MTKTTIIVAGGSGLRMGKEIPKQFLLINNEPILMLTIRAFYRYDSSQQLILVLPESQIEYWQQLCINHQFTIKHTIVKGGDYRYQSVKNGLDAAKPTDLIAIHDGVRPFVSFQTIDNCFAKAKMSGNAIPYTSSIETIRHVTNDKSVTVNRSEYMMIQTPQIFKWEQIKLAYSQPFEDNFTDDASVVEKAGFEVNLVEGNRENIKITTPYDLIIGEAIALKSNLGF